MVDRLGLAHLGRERRLLHPAPYGSEREAPGRRTGFSRNAVNSGASNLPRSSDQLRTHLRGAWSATACSLKRVGPNGTYEIHSDGELALQRTVTARMSATSRIGLVIQRCGRPARRASLPGREAERDATPSVVCKVARVSLRRAVRLHG